MPADVTRSLMRVALVLTKTGMAFTSDSQVLGPARSLAVLGWVIKVACLLVYGEAFQM